MPALKLGLAALLYSALTITVRIGEHAGNASEEHVKTLEAIKPAWSWGFVMLVLNGYAPTAAKLIGGFQALATAVIASSSFGSNILHRRYLLYPAAGSGIALVVSNVLVGEVSGSVTAFILLLHFANMCAEVVWRLTFPAPLISRFVNITELQHRHQADRHVALVDVPSTNVQGVMLSGVIVRGAPPQEGRPPRVLVYMGGNGELWEHSLPGFVGLARRVGATAASFNYRGVGSSTGFSRSGASLVEDAADFIGYLLRTEPGLTERDVLVFGHSIGGAVGTAVVASHFPQCSLVNDRSFSSLADAAHGIAPGIPPSLTRLVMQASFGLLETEASWTKIPHERRLVTFHRGDRIVKFTHASMGRLARFKKTTTEGSSDSEYAIELTGSSSDPHNCDVTDLQGSAEVLRRMSSFFRP